MANDEVETLRLCIAIAGDNLRLATACCHADDIIGLLEGGADEHVAAAAIAKYRRAREEYLEHMKTRSDK